MRTLIAAGVPSAEVVRPAEIVNSEQARARDMIIDYPAPRRRGRNGRREPDALLGRATTGSRPAPALGEHTREVPSWVGLDDGENVDRLVAADVVRERAGAVSIRGAGLHRRRVRAPRREIPGASLPDPRRGRRSARSRMPGSSSPTSTGTTATATLPGSGTDGDDRVPRAPQRPAPLRRRTETGGSSYLAHVGHAAAAIAAGRCRVALITLAGNPRTGGRAARRALGLRDRRPRRRSSARLAASDHVPRSTPSPRGGTCTSSARRPQQLAEIKVAASLHAQHNPNALLQNVVTVDEVLESPMVSRPAAPARLLRDHRRRRGARGRRTRRRPRPRASDRVKVLGHGEAVKHADNGRIDLTHTGATWRGPRAFEEAGVTPADIEYASIYDSFTITVLQTIEDLGFCAKGDGGRFVADGALVAPHGRLPFNTDGGGLCNNHPANRGGMTKVIEAVRQLRGEAHPEVQVPGCELALAHGTGGSLGTRMGSATSILGQADA